MNFLHFIYLFFGGVIVLGATNQKSFDVVSPRATPSSHLLLLLSSRGHNQRMEFLGDSIMQLVATEYLFIHFPDHHEGHLTVSLSLRQLELFPPPLLEVDRDAGSNMSPPLPPAGGSVELTQQL